MDQSCPFHFARELYVLFMMGFFVLLCIYPRGCEIEEHPKLETEAVEFRKL